MRMWERITDIEDSRIAVYRNLKKHNTTRRDNVFIAEGTTVVERLFNSDYRVRSVLISDRKVARFKHRIPDDAVVYHLEHSLAQQLVGYSFHSGVLACGERRESPDLQRILPADGPGLVIVGDQIIDAENVGALIRIAAAFGADAVIFGPGTADPFSRRVLRVSMGNVLYMPVVESCDLSVSLSLLSGNLGYESIATTLNPEVEVLSQVNWPDRVALVFGNETHGVSESVVESCTRQMTIPMWNGTDSLNIAIAAGIFTHSFRSQVGVRSGE